MNSQQKLQEYLKSRRQNKNYPILLYVETVGACIDSRIKENYDVACEVFILDKTKASDICYSTAIAGRDNSMHKRYNVLIRANRDGKMVTWDVRNILGHGQTCVTDNYYIKHIKNPEFEGDIIEINTCEIWECCHSLNYDVKLKKKSKAMLTKAAKTFETYNLNFENQ